MIDSDRMIAELAGELGVGEQLLGRWVRDELWRQVAAEPQFDPMQSFLLLAGSSRLSVGHRVIEWGRARSAGAGQRVLVG